MSEKRFKVGDRVVAIQVPPDTTEDQIHAGSTGTVTYVYGPDDGFDYAVNWDHEFDGGYAVSSPEFDENDCYIYVTTDRHGWCVHEPVLDFYEEGNDDDINIDHDLLSAMIFGA